MLRPAVTTSTTDGKYYASQRRNPGLPSRLSRPSRERMVQRVGWTQKMQARLHERLDEQESAQKGLPSPRQIEAATPGMYTCNYLGGTGVVLDAHAPLRFGVRTNCLEWRRLDGDHVLTLPFSQGVYANYWGAGVVTEDPGIRMVGFGPAGVAAGLLTAAFMSC